MERIMFICTGNTCRSPLAEAIAQKLFKEAGHKVKVASAGLCVFYPTPASPYAVMSARELDVNISNHVSRQMDGKLLDFDIFLTMTESQKEQLISDYPKISDKVYMLSEYACGEVTDVVDPYGGDIDVYRDCAQQIASYVGLVAKKLKI